MYFFISRSFLPTMRNISDKSCGKNQKHILCSATFFPKIVLFMRYCGKYSRGGQATDDNIIWRKRFPCWISKVTDKHTEYVTLTAFTLKQWLRERGSVLRYTYQATGC